MTTIVERDSSSSALFAILLVLLLGGVIAFAYWNGMIGGKTTVIEHNTTIEKVVPAPLPKPKPAPANP